jgi:uncharacterized protein (DUF1499 family)
MHGERVGRALRRALTRTASTLSAAAAIAVLAGVAFAFSGITAPFTGFKIFGAALPASLLVIALGLLGIVVSRGHDAAEDRARARNALLRAAAVLAIFVLALVPGWGLPRINDITTDPADPPVFEAASRDPANVGRDLSYRPGFAEQQRAGYPDLAPIVVAGAPAAVFARAQDEAVKLGWKIVASKPEATTFEASQTSRLFHFVDDVVVRVRPDPTDAAKSRVDVRSKSRDGVGDMGVNARRIRVFARAMGGA